MDVVVVATKDMVVVVAVVVVAVDDVQSVVQTILRSMIETRKNVAIKDVVVTIDDTQSR